MTVAPPISIVAARRTPIGTAGHALAPWSAADLGAAVLPAVLADAGVRPSEVAEVVLGNCTGPGGDLARFTALQAWPDADVAGLTVDRQCASGLAAVVVGAALLPEVVAGERRVVLAGGVESASTSPRPGRAAFAPAAVGDPEMGDAADDLARAYAIGRDAQDRYALQSHTRAAASVAAGRFDAEVVAVGGVRRDERPRPGLTIERLRRMRPAFSPTGTATAGSSCGINDGAAVVALMDDEERRRRHLPGLRIVAHASAALSPRTPGLGLVPAVETALQRARLTLDDVEVIEVNEAFAGQVLACCARLDLDPARVCPEGGALALGHPWGASGAVLLVRLFSQLVRTRRWDGYGLAAVAAGGGQGVAMVVQACP